MGRKSQAKHSGKDKPDKERSRRLRQVFGLSEKILRLSSVLPGADDGLSPWERHVAVKRLLDEVSALERADGGHKKPPARSRSEGLAAFTTWLKENGAQFEGVEISEFPGYELGLRATRAFAEGSSVLTVPRRLMMSEEDARTSVIGGFIENDPLLRSMPNVALALFLLLEKYNEESFWRPYLDTLPAQYTTVLYFTNEELQLLKPSPVLEQSLKLCRNIARQFAYLYTKIHSDAAGSAALRDIFTYDRYRWAVSTVMTRQNSVAGSAAFIPLWDMCNHEHGRITTDYNPEVQQSECYALRDFAVGEQLFIFYGVRTNADLFLHNGFVYPGNVQDSTTIPLGVGSGDQLRDLRLSLLSRLGLAGAGRFALHAAPAAPGPLASPAASAPRTPLSPELLAFVRILCMSAEQLTAHLSGDHTCLVSEGGVSAGLDRAAHQLLLARCRLVAATYAALDMEGGGSTLNSKIVKMLKDSEVRILEQTIDYTQRILDALPEEEAV